MPSCGDCGKGFSSGGCSGVHSTRWQGSCKQNFVYDCTNCMEVCNTKNRRKSHMNKVHTGAECRTCERKFYDQSRRNQHETDSGHSVGDNKANQSPTQGFAQQNVQLPANQGGIVDSPHKNKDLPIQPEIQPLERSQTNSKKIDGSIKIESEVSKSKTFDINRAARYLHDDHARCSNPRKSAESYRAFREVTGTITDAMKDKGLINRREYAGSTWERTSIQNSSDFDVLLVNRDNKDNVTVSRDGDVPAGYAHLKTNDTTLLPSKKLDETKGAIQKIINQKDFGQYDVKMRSHGPAIEVDVYPKGNKEMLASIDMVPTLEKPNGEMYVAKSPKLGTEDPDTYWRKSYSLAAKEKLLTADPHNGCRREVYRTCKVLRNAEPNLSHVTSHQLKTALFQQMDQCQDKNEWSRERIGDGVVRVLGEVRDAYRSRNLPDYFEPGINLLHKTGEEAAENTTNRLDYLIKHPEKLFDAERL